MPLRLLLWTSLTYEHRDKQVMATVVLLVADAVNTPTIGQDERPTLARSLEYRHAGRNSMAKTCINNSIAVQVLRTSLLLDSKRQTYPYPF